jgi:hypothetical protein
MTYAAAGLAQRDYLWVADSDKRARWSAAIVDYLRRSPHAGDTAENIARWWLRANPAEFAEIAAALTDLEKHGMVRRWTAGDGRDHYRIGQALLDAMRTR